MWKGRELFFGFGTLGEVFGNDPKFYSSFVPFFPSTIVTFKKNHIKFLMYENDQARAYAKALNATLFFSSATYNINVNKIFKFITAKIFDLPWTVERNLNVGEPIIDFWSWLCFIYAQYRVDWCLDQVSAEAAQNSTGPIKSY